MRKKKLLYKKTVLLGLLAALTLSAPALAGCGEEKQGGEPTPTGAAQELTGSPEPTNAPQPTDGPEPTPYEEIDISYKRVSVHDPSIIKVDDTYYIFGTHKKWSKSTDLISREIFRTNINSKLGELFGDIWESWGKTASNPDMSGNMWAPDVIYNTALGKYCMYMSVNGDDWNSSIVLLTADEIEGPYEYIGPIVYSGFNTSSHPVERTDVYQVLGEGADLTRYQNTSVNKINAIDPCVKYDENGDLWMVYGSWFGGLYMLKLDAATGLRDYTYTYETVTDVSDAYLGIKIAGGHGVSGEGPYIVHAGDYYYLFVSYGGLVSDKGYQMRTYR
ncbi:MAG: family 43 glycosylhydrolase, partial [Lachnospiraceae bacterium]|nr:family 43 glycosylhydrolase [Lachnospiraceae bacterium]